MILYGGVKICPAFARKLRARESKISFRKISGLNCSRNTASRDCLQEWTKGLIGEKVESRLGIAGEVRVVLYLISVAWMEQRSVSGQDPDFGVQVMWDRG